MNSTCATPCAIFRPQFCLGLGYGLSFAAVSFVALGVMKVPFHQALLLGGVFGSTSSTTVIPVLQQLEIRGPVTVVLILEAALGDIVSVISVGSLFEMPQADTLVTGLITGFLVRTSVAIIAAIVAGVIWSRAQSRVRSRSFRQRT